MTDEAAAVDPEEEELAQAEQELWDACSLSQEQRETWLRLDDELAAAAPPVGRKPSDEERAKLTTARQACEDFFQTLSTEAGEELKQIADLRKRARKHAAKKAEKKDKKARKAASKASTAQAAGDRMESRPPTVLTDKLDPVSENPLVTPSIEASFVHKVYDSIADHWNHTRYKAWPRVDDFIRQLSPGSLVADLGCGNGKNIPAVKEIGGFSVASDICAPLVNIVAETHGDVALVSDCLCSNLRSGAFDAAISIAVLHHLSTVPRRVQALREAARVLKTGGRFLVYCWSYEQDDERSKSHHRFPGQDVLVPWAFRPPERKKGDGEEKENEKGWHEQTDEFQRYCHVYSEGELATLFAQVPELEVVENFFDSGNWCAIARRL